MNNNLEVLIIGAGAGGLRLAHGLVASGLKVHVFERDRTPTDRLQGLSPPHQRHGKPRAAGLSPGGEFRTFCSRFGNLEHGRDLPRQQAAATSSDR
jgi:2-polyprenyl-6-methoxyphenol hydroxylase-like FAD-dependent oxidoreductase